MSAMPSAQRSPRLLPRVGLVRASVFAIVVLVGMSWAFILGWDRQQNVPFFSARTFERAWGFVNDLAGAGRVSTPAYAQADAWWDAAKLVYQTLAMSVLAIMFAGITALATFMLGARNVMTGELAPNAGWPARAVFWSVRASWALVRGVPELVWALLIVFVFSPGILPGAIALGLHNYGVLGKLSAEVVEGMDTGPVRALSTAGATRTQALLYGVLPQALPRFMTYLFYRWEVVIRATIVVGFASVGGLGLEFRVAMSNFHYTTVTLLLMWYLILVVGVDLASSLLRRLAK